MRQLRHAELAELVADYEQFGFAYIRSMISVDELAPLTDALDDGAAPRSFSVTDSQGGKQELSAWLHLGDDLVGVIPRLRPLVEIASAVVGGARVPLAFQAVVEATAHDIAVGLAPGLRVLEGRRRCPARHSAPSRSPSAVSRRRTVACA